MKLPSFKYEKNLWKKGKNLVCGIDEVGRGWWAGPVVSAAVIFDQNIRITFNDVGLSRVRDSKTTAPKEREKLSEIIKKQALAYSISEIGVKRINKHGIGKCSQYAFRKALKKLKVRPDHILIDAFYIKYLKRKSQNAIVKGDEKCFSIAAASIIAKVYRDNLMKKLGKRFPKYRFDLHKGYGTLLHQKSIEKYGLCKIHRTSFKILAGKEKSEEI